jgi:DNA-binding CsgD family transcriptional regulator/uncharacterized protein YcfJ
MGTLAKATQAAISVPAQAVQESAGQLVHSSAHLGRRAAKALIKAHLARKERAYLSAKPSPVKETMGAKGQRMAQDSLQVIKQIREAADPRVIAGGLVGLTAGELVGGVVGGVAGGAVAGPAGAVVGAQVGGFTASMLGLKIGTDVVYEQMARKRAAKPGGRGDKLPRRLGAGRFLTFKSGERVGEMIGLTSGASLGLVIAGPAGGLVGAVIGEALGGHVAEDLTRSRSGRPNQSKPKESAAQWLDRFGRNTMGEAATILAAGSVGSLFGPNGRLVGHRIGLIVSKRVQWHQPGVDRIEDEPLYLLPEPIRAVSELTPDPPVQLTARQLEVLVLLAEQLETEEIAVRLGITPATVNYHKRHIYGKLGVHTPEGAVLTAVELLPQLPADQTG